MPDPDDPRTAQPLAARVADLEATVDEMSDTIDHLALMMTLAAEALRPTGPLAQRR